MSWAKQIPDPNRGLIGTGSGHVLTAGDIRRHLEKNTSEGRRLVNDYTNMAVERTMQQMLAEGN